MDYPPPVNPQQQSEFSQFDSGLTVLVFKQGDDLIDVINHMISFLSAVVTSHFPTTNNPLRNSSNPHQQATIYDGTSTSTNGKQRAVICYNCKCEGHISKQCTKLKRKRDDSWFKDKVLMVQAQANGHILHDEELRFLAYPGIPEEQATYLVQMLLQRDQSAQTVHMLTKPQSFYNHSTKQAIGFQNPFYLKKAWQLEPKLYDGDVIQTNCAIVILDSEETLLLTKESRSKMLLKQKDPMVSKKKVNTKPIDYAALNQL
nr:hypothetical protein [Tanacetum cinerariifolium]